MGLCGEIECVKYSNANLIVQSCDHMAHRRTLADTGEYLDTPKQMDGVANAASVTTSSAL